MAWFPSWSTRARTCIRSSELQKRSYFVNEKVRIE
jgi:hypothetical protein